MSTLSSRQIQKSLRLRGLEVRPEALKAIQSVLGKEEDHLGALDKLTTALKEQLAAESLSSCSSGVLAETVSNRTKISCIVSREHVEKAVLELSKNDEDVIKESTKVLDSFSIPQVRYDPTTRRFQTVSNSWDPLHGPQAHKLNMFRERLEFVHQRMMRNALFTPSLSGESTSHKVVLTPLEALQAGGGDPNQEHHIFGMLSHVTDDCLWIEDLTAKLPLEFSPHVQLSQRLFTPGCMVIAVGRMLSAAVAEDLEEVEHSRIHGRFMVEAMMMPPQEDRQRTESIFPNLSRKLLGLPMLSQHDLSTMQELERECDEDFFVILSDVNLDDYETMRSLDTLFEGFSSFPPSMFVFMGNFSSKPFTFGNSTNSEQITKQQYGDLMEKLAQKLVEFPSLLNSRFVFVPGNQDPSVAPQYILPRPCLPREICERFTAKLPATCRVTFTSNPARIMYYSQEICLFRQEMMTNMRRNCVVNNKECTTENASKFLVETICDQAHLFPMMMDTKPMYCAYERSLRLFPLPHLVVLGEKYEQYHWINGQCQLLNPGSFTSDGSFVVYRPSTDKVEFSGIPRGGGDGVDL